MAKFELWVVVKGPAPVVVRQLPMVRISMTLQMDVQTFLNTDTSVFTTGLASALGLDPSTIRVTGYSATGARRRFLLSGSQATHSELQQSSIAWDVLEGGPRRNLLSGIELTYSIIPPEFTADEEETVSTDSTSTDDEAVSAGSSGDSVGFNMTNLLTLAETVTTATSQLSELEIAGVPVNTASIISEVQEAIPETCVPVCKV